MRTLKEIRDSLLSLGWRVESIKQRHGRWTLTLKSCGNKVILIADSREAVWDIAFPTAFKATVEDWVYIKGF